MLLEVTLTFKKKPKRFILRFDRHKDISGPLLQLFSAEVNQMLFFLPFLQLLVYASHLIEIDQKDSETIQETNSLVFEQRSRLVPILRPFFKEYFDVNFATTITEYALDDHLFKVESDIVAIGSAFFWTFGPNSRILRVTNWKLAKKAQMQLPLLNFTPRFILCGRIGFNLMISPSKPCFPVLKEVTHNLLNHDGIFKHRVHSLRISYRRISLDFLWISAAIVSILIYLKYKDSAIFACILTAISAVIIFIISTFFPHTNIKTIAETNDRFEFSRVEEVNECDPCRRRTDSETISTTDLFLCSKKTPPVFKLESVEGRMALFKNDELMTFASENFKPVISIDGAQAAFVERTQDDEYFLQKLE